MSAPHELVEYERERVSERLHPQHLSGWGEVRAGHPVEELSEVEVVEHRAAYHEVEPFLADGLLRVGDAELELSGNAPCPRIFQLPFRNLDTQHVRCAAIEGEGSRDSGAATDVKHASARSDSFLDESFPDPFSAERIRALIDVRHTAIPGEASFGDPAFVVSLALALGTLPRGRVAHWCWLVVHTSKFAAGCGGRRRLEVRMRLVSRRLPSRMFDYLRSRLWPTEHQRSYRRYINAGGDATFRFDYHLPAEATVLDLGGYHGQWTKGMTERFGCRAYVFEPVRQYVDSLSRSFVQIPSVVVCPFGLGARTRIENIGLADDASSIFTHGRGQEEILIKDVVEWWEEAKPGRVAVAKINIEGGEYELLPRMIESGLIAEVDEVQVQFHDFVPEALQRMDEILAGLALSHEPTYRFPFVWENWRRRTR
jgi:FkbM family methyltransferase